MEKTIEIEGMMCHHCEIAVKKALEALPEVALAQADYEKGIATVLLRAPVGDDKLKKAIEAEDYGVLSIR